MNPKIADILENLAILAQALQTKKENVDTIDILGKIKLLSAQLYLESDMEIITSATDEEMLIDDTTDELNESTNFVETALETNSDTPEEEIESAPVEIEFEISGFQPVSDDTNESVFVVEANKEETFAPIMEFDFEDNNLHNSQEELEEVTPISKETEPIPPPLYEEKTEKIVAENPSLFDEETTETIPSIDQIYVKTIAPEPEETKQNTSDATTLIGQLSLTRRYEFVNFLFAGDMNRFVVFVDQIIKAPNADAREDVFERWYEENQWRRKDESAGDLKRTLRKLIS